MAFNRDFTYFSLCALAALLCASGSRAEGQACPGPAREKLGQSRLLILVAGESWDSAKASLSLYSRKNTSSSWKKDPAIANEEAYIGENGLAWGREYRYMSSLQKILRAKVEGDRKSPAGVFTIGKAFGFAPRSNDANYIQTLRPLADNEPADASSFLPVINGQKMTANDWNCSDDVEIANRYDTIWSRPKDSSEVRADSGEQLGANPLYACGLHVNTNSLAAAKSGSCIFVHQLDEALLSAQKQEAENNCGKIADHEDHRRCSEKIELDPKYHTAGKVATYGCAAIRKDKMCELMDKVDDHISKSVPAALVAIAILPRSELNQAAWKACFPGIE